MGIDYITESGTWLSFDTIHPLGIIKLFSEMKNDNIIFDKFFELFEKHKSILRIKEWKMWK